MSNGGDSLHPHIDIDSSASEGMSPGTMKGRTELLGGTLDINSKPGAGTHIKIQIPIK